jgi:hypothetical protein
MLKPGGKYPSTARISEIKHLGGKYRGNSFARGKELQGVQWALHPLKP